METSVSNRIIVSRNFTDLGSHSYRGYIIHFLCESGSAEFSCGEQQLRITAGCLMAFPDAGAIRNIVCDKDFKCLFILVSDKLLHSLLPARNYSISGHLKLFSNPIISISPEQSDFFREDILMVQKRVGDTHHKFYDEMIGGLLRTLVYDFFDIHSEFSESIPESNRTSEISRQFFLMLESGRVKYDREPEQYASALNVTRKYLNAVIKRQTGSTVSYHINRTARAMIIDYLKENKLSISQIANEMNFASLEYFSRYCKKHLGISPSKYRLTQK